MKKVLFVSLMFLVLSSFVLAFGPNHRMGEARGALASGNRSSTGNYGYMHGHERGGYQTMIKELNLTKDQVKAIDKLREDNMKKNKGFMTDLKKARISLNKELGKDTLDERKIAEIQDSIVVIQKNMLGNHVELIREHRKILSGEQIKKLGKIMNRMDENWAKKKFDDKKWKKNTPK